MRSFQLLVFQLQFFINFLLLVFSHKILDFVCFWVIYTSLFILDSIFFLRVHVEVFYKIFFY